jgi:hypothetical protein
MNEQEFLDKLPNLSFTIIPEGSWHSAIREENTNYCPICAVAKAEGYEVPRLRYIEAAEKLNMEDKLAQLISLAADYDEMPAARDYTQFTQEEVVNLRTKLLKACKLGD